MDSSFSPKEELWFPRVCHHISNVVNQTSCLTCCLYIHGRRKRIYVSLNVNVNVNVNVNGAGLSAMSGPIPNYSKTLILPRWSAFFFESRDDCGCRGIFCRCLICLLTSTGLSSGGNTHLHTNNTQNNTNNKQTTQITTNVEECGPCPNFAIYSHSLWQLLFF